MDNELKIPKLQKKYMIKLHRNATLDSTSSSLKHYKMKLNDGITPLVNVTKKTSINKILDFPVCLSLYTNSVQKGEKDKKDKPASNRKFILKDVKNFKMKNLLIQSQTESKKELKLPKTKNVVSRNSNASTNNIISPIQSNIKNYLLHIRKFNIQSSRNISKPKLKEINNTNLTRLTQRNIPNIKILHLEKIEKNKKTYDLEVPETKSKNYSFGGFKFNLNNKVKEIKYKLQNDNTIIEDNKNNNIDNVNKKPNDKSENENKNGKPKEVNENKDNINKINKKPANEEVKKLKLIIKNKSKKDINKIFTNNNKDKPKNKNKKVILDLKPLSSEENKSDDGNLISPGKKGKKEVSIKKNKYGIVIYNKKVNKVYNKSTFLNEINEELTESLINKRINDKQISQKEYIITNSHSELEKIIFKESTKIIKHSSYFLSQIEMKNTMSICVKEIASNRNKIKIYKEIYVGLFSRKINYKFNCIIGFVTRDYLFEKYESNRISLRAKNKINNINNNNLIKSFKKEKNIKIFKKSQTSRNIEITQNNKNKSENFSVNKSKNIKIHLKKNLGNFIIIQEFILKSLPFYKENYIKLINNNDNIHNTHKISTKRYINFRSFDKKASKKYTALEAMAKKNSFGAIPFSGNNIKKRAERRSGSIINLDSIKQTLRVQSMLKTEQRESNFSVLKQKNFFMKVLNNNENIIQVNEKEYSRSQEKEENYVNEVDKQLESLYCQLMKALFEGKIKFFKNLYMKNKKYIDINQVLVEGNTLLILAAREGNYQITKFLCEEHADVNVQNSEGNTALHFALGQQFYSIADILTMHGAKEDLQNLKGFSPWDCIEHNVD